MTARKVAVKGVPGDRLTTCSICRLGVYKTQPWQWSKNPTTTGIVHTECEETS